MTRGVSLWRDSLGRIGWKRFVTAVAAGLLAAESAQAQVDPRGAMRSLQTPHFNVHFPARLDSLGRVAAGHAERAWRQLARELVAPSGRIELLVADNLDASNGYAQPFPQNRVVVYAAPPIATRELRFHDDWLALVITHEIAHIFHLDRARGLWALGRRVLGRAPITFPNAALPSWVKEGLAVHYESRLTGSGRLVGTEFGVLARANALEGTIPSHSRWSLATTRFPRGQTAYAWGSLALDRAASARDSSMRRFVETTAGALLPPRLRRATQSAFGLSLSDMGGALTDSLRRAVMRPEADRVADHWVTVSPEGWYAETPRWADARTVVWSASTGREVTGLYRASITGTGTWSAPQRLAWRNGLDVNVPIPGEPTGAVLFAQPEWRGPYVLRSDLYRQPRLVGGADSTAIPAAEQRLTVGARLTQPDVRMDGSVVAAQYVPGGTRLVRLSADGRQLQPLTEALRGERWADPRWAPDGARVAAVQLLPDGVSRVVVLDTLGSVQVAVAGARGVFTSPSFTPDGRRLVWASDRSGRMQLETAPLPLPCTIDTLHWREERDAVRRASAVATALYEPSVSPDGRQIAALRMLANGAHVVVAPLDTTGPVARSQWYPPTAVLPPVPDSASVQRLPATGYRMMDQLRPRYWLPLAGAGRDGRPTVGVTSSASDILERHAWNAGAFVEPTRREVDAFAAWRYAGLGVPVVDVSWSQAWDATFRSTREDGSLIGLVARRRRFATMATTWSVPRIRRAVNATVGAQFEWRDFTSDVDAALGDAASLLRRGTRYPQLFAAGSFSTARRALRGISVEEGFTVVSNTSYRWRQDQPERGSWRTVLSARAYRPLDLPGFARHVLAWRGAVGVADANTVTEFPVGGVSGQQAAIVPGVTIGDPSLTFPVRGVAPGVQRGSRALGSTVEYRAPLFMWRRLPSPFALYLDRMSLALFSDAARAWCPATLARTNRTVCEAPGKRDGWIASAGAEVIVDLGVSFDVPYRLRLGGARPYVAPRDLPRGPAWHVTLGGYF